MIDPSRGTANQQQKMAEDIKGMEKSSFNAGWENDIIMRIARKLGRLSIDVELMFGIFSRGSKICTREDFKYCCLQRLDLKRDISDREIDMLLDNKLSTRPNIEQKEFVSIFSKAILMAREEAFRQDAIDQNTMQRYNDMMSTQSPLFE